MSPCLLDLERFSYGRGRSRSLIYIYHVGLSYGHAGGRTMIFLRAGVLQACFVLLHPCLRILLAIYSEARGPQLACVSSYMCTAVVMSQLSSDQLVPLHHHAHFMYPACLFFLMTLLIYGESPDNYNYYNYFLYVFRHHHVGCA
jgi:hypothetical protein